MTIFWQIVLTTVVPALLFFAWSCRVRMRAQRSDDWPLVPATIVESRVVQQGNTRGPRFTFEYVQSGQRQTGHRLWVGPASISVTGNWAERVVARYPVGTALRVAVDPADPAYAVLEPGVQTLHRLMLGISLALMGAGLFAASMLG